MSALLSIYIKKETLAVMLSTIEKKGENGIDLTISVNDESNKYGQNLSGFVSQTKEQREAGKEKFYIGNGKVFWTNGTIKIAVKPEPETAQQQTQPQSNEPDDLPF